MSSPARLRQEAVELSDFDQLLINTLQSGFPVTSCPYDVLAEQLGYPAESIFEGIKDLLQRGVLTRFGPLLNIEKAGGVFSLCALKVPEQRFSEVADVVNDFSAVAHNYRRDHEWNMWFVLATEDSAELEQTFARILTATGCQGLNLPKEKEFYVGLRLQA